MVFRKSGFLVRNRTNAKDVTMNKKKESAGRFDAVFFFYPPGSKPKNATGVTASGPANAQILAVMDAVQARVFAKFEESARLG